MDAVILYHFNVSPTELRDMDDDLYLETYSKVKWILEEKNKKR